MGYFDKKDDMSKKAKDHTKLMEETYHEEIEFCRKNSKLYMNGVGEVHPSLPHEMEIKVIPCGSVEAIMKESEDKTAVLNFASYKEPGGMFLEGSIAQEECLCHESDLYNILKRFEEDYYSINRKFTNRAMYQNRCIFTPDVLFEHNGEKKKCCVLTCAAPNFKAASYYLKVTKDENTEILTSRIKFVMDVSADNNVDTFILGAYGCGVFGQDPSEVASIFKSFLDLGVYPFKKVVFAIPGETTANYKAFENLF